MSEQFYATPQQVSSTVEGEAVILHTQSGVYYSLDSVGTLIWELLQAGSHTVEALRDEICAAYDVQPDQAEADLRALLDDLVEVGLVVRDA